MFERLIYYGCCYPNEGMRKKILDYGKRMRPYYRVWGIAVSEDGKTVIRH